MHPLLQNANNRNDLLDISEVQPLSDRDQPLVDEIYQVLKKHNALKRFGLTLLHKHFDITKDEMLIESVDPITRTQTVKPYKKNELAGYDFIETAWRLDTGKAVMDCKCIKFGDDHSHQTRG
ncbi:MAG: hypothetical protein ACK5XN_03840 [Bacteroidota bacterium]|jgi:hypothetical protein